ncbi:DUF317 domain-containing protein [Kitasatospora sp. NPDC051914]|uniref:DUF317 domain-containing protein n=1 Tax=Kitasatospora sp. NPDC051914 TaxID=3154945 RepID=UPI0034155ABD
MPQPSSLEQPREYRITPRFLAGPTYTGDPGLQPLLDTGATLTQDDLGNVYVTTPDQRIRLGFLPEYEGGELWMVSAHSQAFAPPEWLVTFDLRVAPEIVGEFTTTLAAAHAKDPDSILGDRVGGLDVTDRLLENGWHLDTRSLAEVAYRSSDRLVTLHRRLGHLRHETEMAGTAERWLLEVGPPGYRWYASASSNIPDHLLGALTTAAINPTPVHREMWPSDLARLPAQAIATPTTPTPLEVARLRAATARSASVPRSPASTLAYSTTTRPLALPKPADVGHSR